MTDLPDTTHYVVIDTVAGEPTLRLVCTAAPGAPCRRRPADDTLEQWSADDPYLDLVDGDCWAVEWIAAAGWEEGVKCAPDAVFPSWPVSIAYDEAVVIAPVTPHPTLDFEGEADHA